MDFEVEMKKRVAETEERVLSYLPKEEGFQSTVICAMNYSVQVGGKRLRPLLLKESFCLFREWSQDTSRYVAPFMAALEMIHTYSLVHDDLPAMDNDCFRRGKETTWKKYGDDFGVLAGDGLLNYAFETMLQSMNHCPENQLRNQAKAAEYIARKAGIYGMIGGQSADVELEKLDRPLTEEEIMFIHANKTAALLQASMVGGALLAGASKEHSDKLERIAYLLGIAFQIQDDILDVIGDEKALGKPVGSDAENGKQTFVTMHGLEKSKEAVAKYTIDALALMKDLPGDTEFLQELFKSLVGRAM